MATEYRLATPLTARLLSVLVKEGDEVTKGQELAVLDDAPIQVALTEAQMQLETARSRLDLLEKSGPEPSFAGAVVEAETELHAAEAQHQRAQAEADEARVTYGHKQTIAERSRRMYQLKAMTKNQWEEADVARKEAQAKYQSAQARLNESEVRVENAERLLEYAKREHDANLQAARLDVQHAEKKLEFVRGRGADSHILAPRDGRITFVNKRIGEVADHNDVIVSVMEPASLWVEAYVDAEDLADLKEDMPAEVSFEGVTDSHPGRVVLVYPTTESGRKEIDIPVGRRQVRTPANLPEVYQAVRIELEGELPPDLLAKLLPETTARVKIRRW